MEQMHEIRFEEIEDGSIRLEQQSAHGERDVIFLHPEQLKYITRRTCGMDGATADSIEALERKLSILAAGLERFVCDSSIRGEILDQCGNGMELVTRLDWLLNLAWEYDGQRLTPEDLEPNDKPVYGGATSNGTTKPQTTPENATKRDETTLRRASNGDQLGLSV